MMGLRYRQLLTVARDNFASNGVSGGIFACTYSSHLKMGTIADDFLFTGGRWAMVAGDEAESARKGDRSPSA